MATEFLVELFDTVLNSGRDCEVDFRFQPCQTSEHNINTYWT